MLIHISILGATYCYHVTAVYETCESEFSNVDCETIITTNNIEISALMFILTHQTVWLTLSLLTTSASWLYSTTPVRLLWSRQLPKERTVQIDVRNYEAGAYLIKFITRSGESFTKKIAVTK
jgi:hypothetical protein